MGKKHVWVFLFFALLMSQVAFAQTGPGAVSLGLDFKKAVLSHNKEDILVVYDKIRDNQEAQEYLKTNMPYYFQAYEAYRLLEKVKKMGGTDEAYARQNFKTRDGEETRGTSNVGGDSQVGQPRNNNQRVESFPNQDRRSNQSRVRSFSTQDYMQRNRRTNGQIAIDSPNQDRRSNSQIMRDRR